VGQAFQPARQTSNFEADKNVCPTPALLSLNLPIPPILTARAACARPMPLRENGSPCALGDGALVLAL
jgi:hypothetical protein